MEPAAEPAQQPEVKRSRSSSRKPKERKPRKPVSIPDPDAIAAKAASKIKSVLPAAASKVKVSAAPMSESEAARIREDMIKAIILYTDLADKLLAAMTGSTEPIVIWSDMTQSEIDTLTDQWLARARTNGRSAKRARSAISFYQRVILPGHILAPRAAATFMLLMERGIKIR